MSLRLFVALDLPEEIRRELAKIQKMAQEKLKEGRWVLPSNMHLTLKFLGNTEEGFVSNIKKALAQAVKEVKPFSYTLNGLGGFPLNEKARVFWVGVDKGSEEIEELQQKVEEALLSLGFEKEKRKFHSHITLARFKRSVNIERVLSLNVRSFLEEEILASSVTLFKSELRRNGAVYTALEKIKFSS